MSGPVAASIQPSSPAMTDAALTDAAPRPASAARELETRRRGPRRSCPAPAFEDRVMAAIALEPAPRRAAAAGGGLAGLFGAIGLAWGDLCGRRPAGGRASPGPRPPGRGRDGRELGRRDRDRRCLESPDAEPCRRPSIPSCTRPTTGPTPSLAARARSPTPSPSPSVTPRRRARRRRRRRRAPSRRRRASPATRDGAPTASDDHGGGGGAGGSTPSPTHTTKPTSTPHADLDPGAIDDAEDTPSPTETDDHGGTPKPTSTDGGVRREGRRRLTSR